MHRSTKKWLLKSKEKDHKRFVNIIKTLIQKYNLKITTLFLKYRNKSMLDFELLNSGNVAISCDVGLSYGRRDFAAAKRSAAISTDEE